MLKKILGLFVGASVTYGILGLLIHWFRKKQSSINLNDYRNYREIEPRR